MDVMVKNSSESMVVDDDGENENEEEGNPLGL
jgi:hypothetical protein